MKRLGQTLQFHRDHRSRLQISDNLTCATRAERITILIPIPGNSREFYLLWRQSCRLPLRILQATRLPLQISNFCLRKRSDEGGRFLIQFRGHGRRSSHQRGKVDPQHVHRPRRSDRARRRGGLLFYSLAPRKKGRHRFRSEPARAERRHFEKAIKAGPVFCRAREWYRNRLPK